jgi:hypothetical protein
MGRGTQNITRRNRTSDSTWHSDNTSVFTVSVGTVSCLQPGSGNVTAQFQAIIYTLNCFQQHPTPTVGGPVQVQALWTLGTALFTSPSGLTIRKGEMAKMMSVPITAQAGMPANATVALDITYSADGAVSLTTDIVHKTVSTADVPAGTTQIIEITFTAATSQPNPGLGRERDRHCQVK